MSVSDWAIPAYVVLTLVVGLASRVDVYESFVKGAAEALPIMRRVLPYTVAMIFAVRLMEASGAFDMLSSALSGLGGLFGIPPALIPLMIMRPFSGGGSMGLLAGLLTSLGPDSFGGRVASVYMGSSETLFYTTSVYFGSAGITKTGYVIPVALITDVLGMVIACAVCGAVLN